MTQQTRSELISTLQQSALFGELTRKQLSSVAKACFQGHYEPGEVIIKDEDYGMKMVTLLSGTARVESLGRRIASVGTGDAVGEMSLIDGHRTSAAVVAETPVDAIELYRTAFQKLLDDAPGISKKLLLIQTARLRALDRGASPLS
jgi:CRP/FNR family transcriptional regulator, cyclic AMP receptor protein